ncbi:hypothetical protein MKD33_13910, partial [Chromobacterium piscinae]
ARKAA